MLRHWHGRWRFAMLDDEELGAKLAKVQALVGCPGERATAAMDRPPATGALRARKGLETAARSRWPNATDQGNDDDALAEPHEERGAMRAQASWIAAAVALSLLAAGCGGKGGGSGMPPASGSGPSTVVQPPPPGPRVPPPAATPAHLRALAAPYSDDAEYGAAWGLAQIDAATAYARIARRDGPGTAPGAGARVGVIDTGIDAGHWEFDAGRIANTNTRTDTGKAHGTRVASIIAARRDGPVPDEFSRDDFHGVAWGIDLLQMTAVTLDSADPNLNYEGIDAAELETDTRQLTEWVSEATSVDFVNMSLNVHGQVEHYLDKEGFGPDYAEAVETLAQPDGRVFVFAAGNSNEHICEAPEPGCVEGRMRATSPDLFAGLPVLEASLRGHVVAVVATDRDGGIALFSNRCGIAAKWCIAAPGDLVPVAVSVPDPDNPGRRVRFYDPGASGTSYAAPHVTGGLAVLKHWFRSQMANEALLARLYATARVTPDAVPAGGSCPAHLDLDGDPSACELSSAFGHGVMDLGAATAPVGTTSIALGGRVTEGALRRGRAGSFRAAPWETRSAAPSRAAASPCSTRSARPSGPTPPALRRSRPCLIRQPGCPAGLRGWMARARHRPLPGGMAPFRRPSPARRRTDWRWARSGRRVRTWASPPRRWPPEPASGTRCCRHSPRPSPAGTPVCMPWTPVPAA